MLKKVETYDWEDHAGVVLISWTQLLKTYPRVCCWRRALGVGFWLEKKPVIMTWNLSLLQPSHTILIQYHSIMRFTSLFDIYIFHIYIYVYSIYIYSIYIYSIYIYKYIHTLYKTQPAHTRTRTSNTKETCRTLQHLDIQASLQTGIHLLLIAKCEQFVASGWEPNSAKTFQSISLFHLVTGWPVFCQSVVWDSSKVHPTKVIFQISDRKFMLHCRLFSVSLAMAVAMSHSQRRGLRNTLSLSSLKWWKVIEESEVSPLEGDI